ncbi:hypothetical protein [Mycobacteroides abscessus]|uniref:hypothetical protein n=1 Tax=Mycobacteroides abscessus TaxID=36809 RepID=UPI0019D25D1F|nr:hypothetical protein [Mycobacteroides abscessus]MBN7412657.1 hypothetical protein [Mycobacteroides abscessus subsp. abscessus]
MKALLEVFLRQFDFLYLDPQYRITDSSTDENAVNASLRVTGEVLTWQIVNDRNRLQLSIIPTLLPEQGFWISLIRQYVEGMEQIEYLPALEEIQWARENLKQIDALFSDRFSLQAVCDELRALLRSNAEKEWGPAVGR